MAKYIFVTGGVVSSLGKGIVASSLGRLLKNRGLKVFMQKFDPYINIDPGTMSPYQHGEVYVTVDGAETDLDLGHYERFIDEDLTKESCVTSGKIYQAVINKERSGDYLGKTVQVIPHITNEIKARLLSAATTSKADVIITEIGGTVGDIESLPFLEAIRQWRRDVGYNNTFYVHTTLIPFVKAASELKTKPTQHSVKELRSLGIQPDMLVLRSEVDINDELREKISSFCDVDKKAVVVSKDVKILYEVANNLYNQGADQYICDFFRLETEAPNMIEWNNLIRTIKKLSGEVNIALVGKYVQLQDAYLSINEALKHAGYRYGKKININWILADDVTEDNVENYLKDCDGILVPGGFGPRGIDGKIQAIKFARENNIPFLGICLGMQLATIEFARNVLGISDADSTELCENTTNPIIDYLPDQYTGINLGGTLRLGAYDCLLKENTKAFEAYKQTVIKERHRHRYEFNNKYLDRIQNAGMIVSGINPETGLVEIVELKNHPWFIACQFHPEFSSRPNRAHALFSEFIHHAIIYSQEKNNNIEEDDKK
ncbi:MAG TPA: CTP synthase [Acholeplasmatales bacterium]|jgi:CTP synthase|nr:CTP synthase [Bacilli bacterium]MBS6562288.1 CTP synthase [Staphylococcus sp.]CDC70269.1 cTP synthase [Staphylococcus sp. CAG:324]HAR57198.1 CTP synthase [Acholeplasmatales bacterium]